MVCGYELGDLKMLFQTHPNEQKRSIDMNDSLGGSTPLKTNTCPLKINGWKLEDVFPTEVHSGKLT